MDLNPGDIVLIEVGFQQMQGAKIRPAIVVLDSGGNDFVAAPITSRARPAEFDLTHTDWQFAGLNVPSTARIHKVSVLPKASIRRLIGTLATSDLAAVRAKLCRAFCQRSE
jgi:mRNA interferase MazF